MNTARNLVALTASAILLASSTGAAQAAIKDVDIDSKSGNNDSGNASGDYTDGFCISCNNPVTGTQGNWDLSYGVTVTGSSIKNFVHTLTSTVTHNSNTANTLKVQSKHGAGLPPRKVTRKNSVGHGSEWDNQTATLKPKDSGNGDYTSKWDHSTKKLAYNTAGTGSLDEAVVFEYSPGMLALSTSSPMTIVSESELFAGAYQVEFDVLLNLVDDKIGSVAYSSINVTSANGFGLYGGQLDFISEVPAGDPYGEVFEALGSLTEGRSIADTLGMTFEIKRGTFEHDGFDDIMLDALTLGFDEAIDLREVGGINGNSIMFGAQLSVDDADFDFDHDVDGADFLTLQRGYDGPYDDHDAHQWHQRFGNATAFSLAATHNVPEPASWLLLIMGLVVKVSYRSGNTRIAS